jgi:[ribosomal protein S5]-alanine N-acetyltransferase
MRLKIETSRLILRSYEPTDAEAAFGWFGDPVVMRFTPTGPDASIGQTNARLNKYRKHQIAHGFSKWIIVDRDTGRLIGDSELLVLQDYGWIDLGFRLARPYWGRGLATKVASAWVHAAFKDLNIDQLTALVHPQNAASIRVLVKLGFRLERRDAIMGMNSLLFTLEARDARNWADSGGS